MIKSLRKTLFSQSSRNLYNPGEEMEKLPNELKVVRVVGTLQLEPETTQFVNFATTHPLGSDSNAFLKRSLDVVFSLLVCILILSWLVPLMAILIKLESKGPVFFKQLRTGQHNQPFYCYKFRSLRVNNEADQKQVTSNDDRVTKIGKFLRKSNIDELPQFYNVLLGHMSIVGPRPHMLKHTEEFADIVKNYKVRHLVKPGVTGLAQVSGYRGEILHREQLIKRVDHDFSYIYNWNIWLDLKIIYRTIYNTVTGDEKAY